MKLLKGLRGHLITVYIYLMGRYRADRARFFSEAYGKRKRGNRHKLQCRRFILGVRKRLFNIRMVKQWSRGPEWLWHPLP